MSWSIFLALHDLLLRSILSAEKNREFCTTQTRWQSPNLWTWFNPRFVVDFTLGFSSTLEYFTWIYIPLQFECSSQKRSFDRVNLHCCSKISPQSWMSETITRIRAAFKRGQNSRLTNQNNVACYTQHRQKMSHVFFCVLGEQELSQKLQLRTFSEFILALF